MTDEPLIGRVDPPALQVMTFNIRRRMERASSRADRWEHRATRLHALVRAEQPTLLGAQEALPDQTAFVLDALGAGYRFVGDGRDAHRGEEACPLFYDAGRLSLLRWWQTALSNRPDVPGSRSWGNRIPRIVVAAAFRDGATGVLFLAVNTHLDAFSSRSRLRAAEHLRQSLAVSTAPVILTGDLNARPGSRALRALLDGGALRDTWVEASVRLTPEWGTFARYRVPRADGARIDWIAVSPGIAVESAAINARVIDGGWGSDHLPVQAVIHLPAPRAAA
ncbi:endonuclease/exonuclease/phosphatase family protein [Microbacterium sp. CFBP9034]|uniref:endonuclease/exonuclease/phosphatase family protein n=1 Tax=Microbacterium sp. CFBP9034 TaxID=3096540 RepID=UPI002A69D0E5|nr:endonuclease/exonuclease/phosphatase family protein [Microbacterium sp. CFBP9034]MDY0910679.1 endonuclease/exonuclease/phosphatase family protein [Microbacterium sp. CFBP9034]